MNNDVRFGAHVQPGPEGFILCIITKDVRGALSVIQVGIHRSGTAAAQWGMDTIAMIRSSGDDQAHPPDYMEQHGLRKPVIAQHL